MIRALLKKQLLELGAAFVRSSKTGKQRSRVGTFGYTLLFAALMLLVMLSFGSMALPLAVTLVPQGLDWLYFVLMELSALTVSVLASAFTSYGVNHLRSLGDCFITEPPNAKKLQKRANPENPVDKNGRMKRKKRFGRPLL